MIVIACYKIIDGKVLIPTVEILEKHKETKLFGFNINNAQAWHRYLTTKYLNKSEDANGVPRVFRVYNFGGRSSINFFPGLDDKGKNKNLLKYGRLRIISEHNKFLRKC